MKAKKPWKVAKIFGSLVPVFRVPNLSSAGYYGLFETHDTLEGSRILMEDKLSKVKFERILLHEMFHACMSRTNMTSAISDEIEEMVVDNFARVVMDNFDITWKKETKR